uniref:Uncharacterized protein n=1 Tax=Arundo donax TaxID=35708 RepID=A0A0A9HSM5_ARUDO
MQEPFLLAKPLSASAGGSHAQVSVSSQGEFGSRGIGRD